MLHFRFYLILLILLNFLYCLFAYSVFYLILSLFAGLHWKLPFGDVGSLV